MFFIALLNTKNLIGHSFFREETVHQASFIGLKALVNGFFVNLREHRLKFGIAGALT